jgi:hypothetical protein
MKLSRASVALYLAIVFASGAALGVFGERYYAASQAASYADASKAKRPPSPEEFRRNYLKNMRERLLLSDEQVERLSAILDETRMLMEELHKRQLPEQRRIQEAQNAKIRALFDPVQLEKYDEMMKRIAERNKANRDKNWAR